MERKTAPVNLAIEKNYDSEMCGSIPLHLVNLIQPHGMLLVLDKQELRILQASANTEVYLQIAADELLSKPFSSLIPEHQFNEVVSKLKSQNKQDKIPFTLSLPAGDTVKTFTAIILQHPDYILVELEESRTIAQESFLSLYQHLKYITSLLKQPDTISEIAQLAVEELKKFSGFDKVMVYQFDPNWNGMVIAQAREADMDDYMDLRFPASDVPKQARDLYFKNPYRLIPTRSYTPVRLVPVLNPVTQKFTDLSDCSLRSVANVHLEYLANMRVDASMSLPLIIDNKLWGLIACHHKTPKYLSYEMRSAMELLSDILAAQLQARQKEEAMAHRVKLRSLHASLLEQIYSSPNFAEGLLEGETTILELFSLSGAAVFYEGNTWVAGETPSPQEMKELVSWLRRNNATGLYVTDTLPQAYPRGKDFQTKASGLMAIPINKEQGEFILGFRPEVQQTIKWGGDPNNAVQMEPDGKSYHPRNSFAIYKEVVKNTSLPWMPDDAAAAETLRHAVLEKLIKDRY
ncbi:GAF domain-containing protein [Pontibacter sp. Tf4]|uniref:GAF domain-containing protein n=1 Tax=Pontibacter sp. Tf4 TaxID=2761620 RepID=UPI0016298124|nr:GAF domain-containing protein [Pontibacter sp. Tf4]MBB6611613.1 GAF domain-containing protein [Pontibacter sp. Tf4]